jgi:Protein of unknown function (DUF2793)
MPDSPSFPALSPRLALPYLFAGQAQKEVTLNEVAARLDCLVHCAIEAVQAAPPGAPVAGQTWLVAAAASGAWSGRTDQLACWHGSGWLYAVPQHGMAVFDKALGCFRLFQGSWSAPTAPALPAGGTVIDPQARTAIAALVVALRGAGVIPA